jgi:Fe-S-cluster-containing dehydrogenase component
MKVMAQVAMVMNLDKCIGCHTCSVTCKQAWTNREGTEYMWFNDVETRPGVGYPRGWEDQDKWKGGWRRTATGRLVPRQGGRLATLGKIFSNPNLPGVDDYYEPWTYEYDKLLSAPASANTPTARARSTLTGEHKDTISWGPNWDDDLGGSMETLDDDPVLHQMNLQVRKSIEDTFMFYLPRICEHCLNPACVASCPSGAMYKRAEDGIVLVDQDRCRGWRMCVSGCPYKKVYFNHRTGKAEKCTLCYPRLEAGQPTVCSETCVGRLRYLGVLLYDADRVTWAASRADERDLYAAQREILLDPNDPDVVARAKADGVSHSWIEAAQASPVWSLISPLPDRPAAASGVPHPADGLVCAPVVAGGGRRHRLRLRRGEPQGAAVGDLPDAHPDGVPGRAVHRRRHCARREVVAPACGDALLYARRLHGGRRRRVHSGGGRDDRGGCPGHVSAAVDRQVSGPLCDSHHSHGDAAGHHRAGGLPGELRRRAFRRGTTRARPIPPGRSIPRERWPAPAPCRWR